MCSYNRAWISLGDGGCPRHGRMCGSIPGLSGCQSYSFSIAAVTNHHPHSSLNHTHLLSHSCLDQMSDKGLTGWRSRCQRGCIPFWKLKRSLHCLASSCSERPPTFPGSVFKPARQRVSLISGPWSHFLCLSSAASLPRLRTLVIPFAHPDNPKLSLYLKVSQQAILTACGTLHSPLPCNIFTGF